MAILSQLSSALKSVRDGLTNSAHFVGDQASKGRILSDISTVEGLLQATTLAATEGKGLDDRQLLMEKLIAMLAQFPDGSLPGRVLAGNFIQQLWNDLPHPPRVLLGDEYRFRTCDGSYNNIWQPTIGAANQPYARTVPAVRPKPSDLPDPSVIFDAVFKRPEGSFKPHPSGLSSLFFNFATTVILCEPCTSSSGEGGTKLRTGKKGNNEQLVKQVRTGFNGRIHPDVVADERIFLMPPPVVAIVVLFSRNHNYICEQLLEKNEYGKFGDWEQLDEARRTSQDDEIFGTARLINCVTYAQVVLHDYLRSILGLTSLNSDWNLDPLATYIEKIPTSTGNHSSAEFNAVYRWHSAIGQKDKKWISRAFLPNGKNWNDLTMREFYAIVQKSEEALGDDVTKFQTPDLRRGKDGRFDDAVLKRILVGAIEDPAHSFGANSVPEEMRLVEIMGIESARNVWKLCTFNELRTYLGLKPVTSFEELNPDPKVSQKLKALYRDIDDVELYVGLVAEQSKDAAIGSGLCPGFTISRGILSDAVALVRGDRFFTDCCDAAHLTSWGMKDITPEPKNGSFGGFLPKLIERSLPGLFHQNSTYVQFPFQTPESIKANLIKSGVKLSDYQLSP